MSRDALSRSSACLTAKDCADLLERELLPAYQHGSPGACAIAAAAEYLRCVVERPEVREPYQYVVRGFGA